MQPFLLYVFLDQDTFITNQIGKQSNIYPVLSHEISRGILSLKLFFFSLKLSTSLGFKRLKQSGIKLKYKKAT